MLEKIRLWLVARLARKELAQLRYAQQVNERLGKELGAKDAIISGFQNAVERGNEQFEQLYSEAAPFLPEQQRAAWSSTHGMPVVAGAHETSLTYLVAALRLRMGGKAEFTREEVEDLGSSDGFITYGEDVTRSKFVVEWKGAE